MDCQIEKDSTEGPGSYILISLTSICDWQDDDIYFKQGHWPHR